MSNSVSVRNMRAGGYIVKTLRKIMKTGGKNHLSLYLFSVTQEKSFDLGRAHGRCGGNILTLSKL
jgi:hypothetical protein